MIGHILLAVSIQVAFAAALRSWSAGAAAACCWALAREITQAEYRWIEQFGHGLRANMPWWGALDLRVWQSLDPWLDWGAPTVAVLAIAAIANLRKRPAYPITLDPE